MATALILAERHTRTEMLNLLDQVEGVFGDWRSIRTRDEANVFLAVLIFAARWSK